MAFFSTLFRFPITIVRCHSILTRRLKNEKGSQVVINYATFTAAVTLISYSLFNIITFGVKP